jgi:hypothetical protein
MQVQQIHEELAAGILKDISRVQRQKPWISVPD